MGSSTPSAGDHQWRAITVHIHPGERGTGVTVVLRNMRGIETVWQQRALAAPIPGLTLGADPSVRDALELVSAALWGALARTEDH
jgi:hypothetical protein